MAVVEPDVMRRRIIPRTHAASNPAEVDRAERHGFGLCLSGGGYRATLYHLGAARRLHELGALNRLDTISAVSGGSLFAALLAKLAIDRKWKHGLEIKDFEQEVAQPVRALTSRDLRTAAVTMPGRNARHLERLIRAHVCDAPLSKLPVRPDFVFCATDLTHGVNFAFSRTNTGSYKVPNPDGADEWPLAFALAASACFPPVFGPLPVRSPLRQTLRNGDRAQSEEDSLRCTDLSDGGLYDNLGLEPVWKWGAQLLVSDGGAPFEEVPIERATRRPIKHLLRYSTVARKQARSLRVIMFHELLDRDKIDGALWDIGCSDRPLNIGYSAGVIKSHIARIRTDLDHFSKAEQEILENHGYWSVEDQLQKDGVRDRLGSLLDDADAEWPHPEWENEDEVRHALRNSHKRIVMRRLLRPRTWIDHAINSFELLRGARG